MSRIRLSKSVIGEEEKRLVSCVLDREFLGMGADVLEYESKLSAFFGRPVVCVANGTAALQLALQAMGIGKDDEVLVPSLTYVASFQAIAATGAKPVACDINEHNLIIDIKSAKDRLTSKTKAIMPVFYGGAAGDVDGIYAFANDNGIRVVEDAAHAFGSTHDNKKIGSFGDVSCFSFDGIKNITSGEGGCLVSDDEALISKAKDYRLLGVERDTEARFKGKRSWEFDVVTQGWRYHMSNIMAAIGIAQLNKREKFATKRKEMATLYSELLREQSSIEPVVKDFSQVVPHIYVVRIKNLKDRQALRDALLAKGIETGVHYFPNHRLSYFRDASLDEQSIVENIYPELLTLPLHADMSADDVAHVVECIVLELAS